MSSQNETKAQRLWVVTELYYPEETSTGHHMTMIAEGLTKDFEVNVLCGQPNYSQRGTTAPRFELHNEVHIRRLPGTRLNKNVIPFRIINMVTFGLPVFLAALFSTQSWRQGSRSDHPAKLTICDRSGRIVPRCGIHATYSRFVSRGIGSRRKIVRMIQYS